MTTLFGVSILVTTYPEYSKQTLLCNKHNVSNLIHSSHNRSQIPPTQCGLKKAKVALPNVRNILVTEKNMFWKAKTFLSNIIKYIF